MGFDENGKFDEFVKGVPSLEAIIFPVIGSLDVGDPCFCADIVLLRFRLRSSSGSYEARFHVGLRFRVECGRGPSYIESELSADRRRLMTAGGDAAGTSVTTYCL